MHIWAGLTKVNLVHLIMVRFWQTYHQNDQQGMANWMESRKTGKTWRDPKKAGIPVKTGRPATLLKTMQLIDWVEVLHPVMDASGYVRCPCKGHGVGCLWVLLLLKTNPGDNRRYENQRHKCAIYNSIQFNRNDMKITDTNVHFKKDNLDNILWTWTPIWLIGYRPWTPINMLAAIRCPCKGHEMFTGSSSWSPTQEVISDEIHEFKDDQRLKSFIKYICH